MFHQANADLLCAEQDSQHLERARPFWLIPCVLRNKNGVSGICVDLAGDGILRNVKILHSRKRNVEPGKMRYIGERRRRDRVLSEVNSLQAVALQIAHKLRNDQTTTATGRYCRYSPGPTHGLLP